VSFARNVGMMAIAGIVAQAVPLALMPVLSRLYTPVDLGVLALIVSIAAILSPLCTARFELAIMLPERASDAYSIAGIALALAVAVTLLACVLIVIVVPVLESSGKLDEHGSWLYFAPLLALAISIGQVGNILANRRQEYGKIARAGIFQQLVNGVTAIIAGLAASSPLGLIVGRILGTVAYTAAFWQGLREALRGFRRDWTGRDALRNAYAYRQFAFFNMPYSLLGSFSRDFLVYAFTAFRDVALVCDATLLVVRTFPSAWIVPTLAFFSLDAMKFTQSDYLTIWLTHGLAINLILISIFARWPVLLSARTTAFQR